MSQRLKKVRSNIDSEVQSVILSGNLQELPTCVENFESDEYEYYTSVDCNEENEIDNIKRLMNEAPSNIDDYRKANMICDEIYGIDLLDIITKLLINEELNGKDFALQALAYKVQSLTRGVSGIR